MPDLPSQLELVEEYRLEVVGDPDTNLTDFSEGSVNRGFAGIAATATRGTYRWIARLARRAFIQGANDADLDYVIADRIGDALPRFADEGNEAYRSRYFDYVEQALERGTEPAWRFFLEKLLAELDPLESYASEDLEAGSVRLKIAPAAGYSSSEAQEAVEASLPEWRILGIPADLEVG